MQNPCVSRCPKRLLLLLVTLFCGGLMHVAAQQKPDTPKGWNGLNDPAELKSLKYRNIGPAWGGRVSRSAGVPGDPSTYYVASASGGVWKSTDGGITFKSIFDDQPISSIGSIAVAPSDPNVIYVGSGEANIRGNVAAGNGIYRSVDAGKTWTHVWNQEGQIGTMAVDPRNADVAFAAVLGHAFGPNPERGVYRTKDGGKTWQQILKKDNDTGASDVALDPSNPNIVFAGLWQARRRPWDLTSGGPGSGLYVSRDGGDSWKQLTEKGLPKGVWGKIGVAVAPSDGRRVYALIEAEEGGLFSSEDGGDSWSRASGDHLLRERAWYYSTLTVNPSNPNEVWCPQVPMLKSIDAGKTFTMVKGIAHGDNHDIWIDPKNPRRIVGSSDGGVNISVDGGETWYAAALPIGQFYHVAVDSRTPFHVAGALQDIGTAQGPSNSLRRGGIRNTDYHRVGGGEAGWVVSDTSDPNIVYAGEYGGYISRYDDRTHQARNVGIYPEDGSGHGAEDLRVRFQWTAPIAVSPHDAKVIYHGGNVLYKTANGGQSWTAISPDLTRNDKSKQKYSGGPITGDMTGVEVFDTIFVIAESPAQKDLIWVGSDDGLVHVTRDGGKNWKNVTRGMSGIPEWGTVSMIEPSGTQAGTAYVVVDAHRLDDMHPYLYKTTNFGESWTRLDSKLPQDVYLHSVRIDPARPEILYLGAERGVAFSNDGGVSWRSLKLNLPTVAVHDLLVKDNSLVLGTHGRSFWIFDHLSVLRDLSPKSTGSQAGLFTISDAVRWRWHSGPPDKWAGENPPRGAVIYYWLKESVKDDIKIEILDSENHVVNTLSSKPKTPPGIDDDLAEAEEAAKKAALSKDAGVHQAVWDLTFEGSELVQNAKLDAGDPSVGPMVLPGTYSVRLTAGGQSVTAPLLVVPDPRVQLSAEDLRAQVSMATAARDDITGLALMIRQLRSLRQQLSARNDLLKGNSRATNLIKDSESLIAKLDALEAKLHNPKAEIVYDILAMRGGARLYSRLSYLYDSVTDSDGPPTQGAKEVYADQKRELESYGAEFKQLISTDLSRLNELAKRLDFPIVIVQ
ncbi:MAG: glycosyl hydrolase [Acidobacteria bacterium]|nr:glycosyl hydrolase [Acidobacteriota bacterium]